MADSAHTQRSSYPLAAYNFRVSVDDQSMSFTEVSGLQREYHTATYRHGRSFIEGEQLVKFRFERYTPVTLKRGSVQGATFLHEWIDDRAPRAMQISLCDDRGEAAIIWDVAEAFAVKLEAPTFDAGTNEVSVESLELLVRGVEITDIPVPEQPPDDDPDPGPDPEEFIYPPPYDDDPPPGGGGTIDPPPID